MIFFHRKPRNVEAYIAAERKHDDEMRRRFLEEYEKKKRAEQAEHKKVDGEGKSARFKKRFAGGARTVGRGLKRAYEYEPSEKTKTTFRKAARGARRELASLDELSPRRRRAARRSYDDEDRPGGQDIIDTSDFSGYAAAFDPWQNKQVRSGNSEHFTNEFEGYADQFDVFKQPKQQKGRKSSSAVFDNPFQGYLDAFDPWASRKRRR